MISLLNRFDEEYIIKKDDILEISSKYAKENKVEPYLSDIIFTNNNGQLSTYNEKDKIITFNPKQILEECKRLLEELRKHHQIDEKYYYYYINYYYLHYIYKELTHLSQRKSIEEKDKEELYRYLIKVSNKFKESKPHIYKKIPELVPKEREAKNLGLYTAYDLMKYTKLPRKESKIMYLEYLKALISSYIKNEDEIISPIELFSEIDKNIDLDKLKELINTSKVNEAEKMNLGLPLLEDEYNSMENNISKRLIKSNKNE